MRCLSPITLRRNGEIVSVPCQKCVNCLSNRRQEWSTRLEVELETASSAHFITLTYADKNLPLGFDLVPTLVKKDLQDFIKRLRHHAKGRSLRYYAVGEYGGETERPHYHAIIFNLQDKINIFKDVDAFLTIEGAWSLGQIHVGSVTPASISYVCKYLINNYKEDGRKEPPFSVMSRNPGLGKGYVEKMRSYHAASLERNYVTKRGGEKSRLPRYFREQLYGKLPRSLQNVSAVRRADQDEKKAREKYESLGNEKPFEVDQIEKQQDAIRRLKLNKKSKL